MLSFFLVVASILEHVNLFGLLQDGHCQKRKRSRPENHSRERTETLINIKIKGYGITADVKHSSYNPPNTKLNRIHQLMGLICKTYGHMDKESFLLVWETHPHLWYTTEDRSIREYGKLDLLVLCYVMWCFYRILRIYSTDSVFFALVEEYGYNTISALSSTFATACTHEMPILYRSAVS